MSSKIRDSKFLNLIRNTEAQEKFIREHKLHDYPEFLTKHDASKLIDKFKNKKKRKSPKRGPKHRLPGEPIRI